MSKLPQHKASNLNQAGIYLRIFMPEDSQDTPVTYMHQDDYYIFGFVDAGRCLIHIDFDTYSVACGEVAFTQPGQVHEFVTATNLKAYLLLIEASLLEETQKRVFEQYALNMQTATVNHRGQEDLNRLFKLLADRCFGNNDASNRSLIRHLSLAIIDVIAETLKPELEERKYPKRYVEHTVTFRKLLEEQVDRHHAPGFYANRMNISTGYLNEAVKTVTGSSVRANIRNEIIRRAKRKLAYSNASVKETARDLGFDDCAYFTRLFTSCTGISPSAFRKNFK